MCQNNEVRRTLPAVKELFCNISFVFLKELFCLVLYFLSKRPWKRVSYMAIIPHLSVNSFSFAFCLFILKTIVRGIQSPALLFTFLKRWSNKNKTMHFNSYDTTGFLGRIVLRIGLGRSLILRVHLVFLKFETHFKT